MAMDAGSHRRRLALLIDIVAAIADEGPGMTIGDHVGPEVAPVDMANCDSAAVAIEGPGLAGDVAFANQCAQVFGGYGGQGGASHPEWLALVARFNSCASQALS